MCDLCLKLIGSSEDRKVSSAIAEWVKGKKYDKESEREIHVVKENNSSNVPHFPYPAHMFQNFPFGIPPMPMPGFMNFRQGRGGNNFVITLNLVRKYVCIARKRVTL